MILRSISGALGLILVTCTLMVAQTEKRLLSNINSEYDEQNPVLAPDGQALYFTRSNHPENAGGTRDNGDIWVSTLTADHQWASPQNVRSLNNKNWNGVIGFSGDGATIYLYNHYKQENGIVKTQGIASATKTKKGWSEPKDIHIPYFKNLSKHPGGYISKDGKVLLLSMESYGTKGVEDIYVCLKKDNGHWSEPRNLGSNINTKFQEFTPYISDDNKTLYFSSNGYGGKGSCDIFISERQDGTWTNWSPPKALVAINSKGRETGYQVYQGLAIYASTTSSDGYSDIRFYTEKPIDSIMALAEPVPTNSDVKMEEINSPEITVDSNSVTLFGKVFDEGTQKSISAIITVEGSGESNGFKKEVSTKSDNGYYSLHIPAHGGYEVRVDAPGYISKRESLDINTGELKVLEMNYALQAISIGTTVNLKNVLFEQSKPAILESSYKELDLVVDLMKQNPDMKIRLEGHTDNRGVPKYNLKLSKRRVEAVEGYLVKQGVSARRISGKGYGGSRPIADNDDPKQRKLNRRVEFTIIKE